MFSAVSLFFSLLEVHLDGSGRRLLYLGDCVAADVAAPFFLHIFPKDPAGLPEHRRQYGFVNLDFDFYEQGFLVDGRCAAERTLPDYPVSFIRTGQDAGEKLLWIEYARLP